MVEVVPEFTAVSDSPPFPYHLTVLEVELWVMLMVPAA